MWGKFCLGPIMAPEIEDRKLPPRLPPRFVGRCATLTAGGGEGSWSSADGDEPLEDEDDGLLVKSIFTRSRSDRENSFHTAEFPYLICILECGWSIKLYNNPINGIYEYIDIQTHTNKRERVRTSSCANNWDRTAINYCTQMSQNFGPHQFMQLKLHHSLWAKFKKWTMGRHVNDLGSPMTTDHWW